MKQYDFVFVGEGLAREKKSRTLWTCGKAKKAHTCVMCGDPMPKGDAAWRPVFEQNGVGWFERVCTLCITDGYTPPQEAKE